MFVIGCLLVLLSNDIKGNFNHNETCVDYVQWTNIRHNMKGTLIN